MTKRRLITAPRLLGLGIALLALAVVLVVYPSNDYIFLPDKAHPVAPIVTAQGARDPVSGGIYYVDVQVRKASLLERLFGGWPSKGADLYPASAVNPPGVNDRLRRQIDLEDMHQSQEVAAAVALKALGKKVTARPTGISVTAIEPGFPAVGKLAPDDVITAVDGVRTLTPVALFKAMAKHKPGDVVAFTVRRGKKTLVERVKTRSVASAPGRAVVGIGVAPSVDIHLPLKVQIDAGGVGGPSAGLAFTLDLMEELGKDILHGHKIAATGTIALDGTVGEIGGIKQKTIGAKQAGVDAFLVPAGDNARDARKYADGLKIIPVQNFQQALRALATLR